MAQSGGRRACAPLAIAPDLIATLRPSLLRVPIYPGPNAETATRHLTYSILPHLGGWRHGETFGAAHALTRQLRVAQVDARAATALNRPTGAAQLEVRAGAKALPPLTLSGDGVESGAIKLAEDSDNWTVRLVERYRRPAIASLRVPDAQLWRDTDFVERATSDWNAAGAVGGVALQLKPWLIRTVEVKKRDQ